MRQPGVLMQCGDRGDELSDEMERCAHINDGARAITQRIAQGKAMIALKTKGASDPAVASKADPAIMGPLGVARPGGFPLMAGNDVVGAIAVSGSPSGQADEVCARAAIAKIQSRIK